MSDFVPAWVDMSELCRQTCLTKNTVDKWVADGLLPPPKIRGGKQMWKWSEVDAYLTNGKPPETSGITDNVRRALQEKRAGH